MVRVKFRMDVSELTLASLVRLLTQHGFPSVSRYDVMRIIKDIHDGTAPDSLMTRMTRDELRREGFIER